ncbi:hypothetical protein OOK41_21915 [Micromonospora sp. NBC_01655]|uniref:hypothetical protein n=1 Tax=Micromonospora sp. NBC_01655 TaxID=2975983 RepID=UPI0022575037|nr:hypothetical protein [Micromonospora sp. NBC_01655]MCX4472935.1 hypothetical protein [Micromonospora sp. NBC_01655]
MTDLVIRPLVAGEENLFESMPDPLPHLRQVGYADGPQRYYAAMPTYWRRRPEVLAVMKAPMAAARLAGLVRVIFEPACGPPSGPAGPAVVTPARAGPVP